MQSVGARADAGIGWGERAPRVGQPGRGFEEGGGVPREGHSGKNGEEALPQIRRRRYGQAVL